MHTYFRSDRTRVAIGANDNMHLRVHTMRTHSDPNGKVLASLCSSSSSFFIILLPFVTPFSSLLLFLSLFYCSLGKTRSFFPYLVLFLRALFPFLSFFFFKFVCFRFYTPTLSLSLFFRYRLRRLLRSAGDKSRAERNFVYLRVETAYETRLGLLC